MSPAERPPTSSSGTPCLRRSWALVGGVLAGAVLLGSPFLLYTRPGFLVMLADMLWACF